MPNITLESDIAPYSANLNQKVKVIISRLLTGDPCQDFSFPGGFTLPPGQPCLVYTNEGHSESCGFSLSSGTAIWNNGGDCAYLFRQDGSEASRYCY